MGISGMGWGGAERADIPDGATAYPLLRAIQGKAHVTRKCSHDRFFVTASEKLYNGGYFV